MNKPYNKGDDYEEKIFQICEKKKILARNFNRAGASDQSDIKILHQGKEFNVEIKADENADYGQKYLKWEIKKGWQWVKDDNVTKMYNRMKIIENYINKNFIPKKFTKKKSEITNKDKRFDQINFEKPEINIPLYTLFEYYLEKNCYYIQLENCGFYHLKKDINNFGTSQFDGVITLRLRAKTINSTKKIYSKNKVGKKIRKDTGIPTPWNYGFLGVIKMSKKPSISNFDLQPINGRKFPKILP